MKVVLCGDFDAHERQQWLLELRAALPEVQWLTREAALAQASDVNAAVVANPPPGSLQGLPRLRLIQSLWAGVDRLLADRSLPEGVPLARMVDPAMTTAMIETALWAVLSLHRGFFSYAQAQREGRWAPHAQRRADEVSVLVLGQGEMGRSVASRLAQQGYRVSGWRRSEAPSAVQHTPAQNTSAQHSSEASAVLPPALQELLAKAQIVVNLLPLTAQTRGLLDHRFFSAMPGKASLVNLARGAHVVDADLIEALDSGHLRHAVLDVFHTEPLPAGHRYWSHPRVTLLPHAAAMTDARSAAGVVAQNLRALQRGDALAHLVDRTRGY
jgi:glyoxylate/hydroxypyruvate reductase A